jgi:CRP-like cAMP-binding protein
LFNNISTNEIEKIFRCLSPKEKSYTKGEFILHTEDKISSFCIILSGSVQIIREDFWGNRDILAYLGSLDIFGEVFAFSEDNVLPFDIVATENTSVLFIEFEKLVTSCHAACSFHNTLIKNILSLIAKKNIALTQKIQHITKRSIREKLLSYFSAEALKNGTSDFEIPLNRQQLADYLAVDRSALSFELGKMQRLGILSFKRSYFILHHLEK